MHLSEGSGVPSSYENNDDGQLDEDDEEEEEEEEDEGEGSRCRISRSIHVR